MTPSTKHTRSKRNALVCQFCGREFYACRSDKKTCSATCKTKMNLEILRMAAAREMTQEIIDLYQTFRYDERIKAQAAIY